MSVSHIHQWACGDLSVVYTKAVKLGHKAITWELSESEGKRRMEVNGTHSSKKGTIVVHTLPEHNKTHTHLMSWPPHTIIMKRFCHQYVNCPHTQWHTCWQEALGQLTGCKQQQCTATHTDLHSTWVSTGERWDDIHSCSWATLLTAVTLLLHC